MILRFVVTKLCKILRGRKYRKRTRYFWPKPKKQQKPNHIFNVYSTMFTNIHTCMYASVVASCFYKNQNNNAFFQSYYSTTAVACITGISTWKRERRRKNISKGVHPKKKHNTVSANHLLWLWLLLPLWLLHHHLFCTKESSYIQSCRFFILEAALQQNIKEEPAIHIHEKYYLKSRPEQEWIQTRTNFMYLSIHPSIEHHLLT